MSLVWSLSLGFIPKGLYVHHTALGRFSVVDISTAVGIVPPVPKKKGLCWKNLAERKLSDHVYIVRYWHYWHPLGCRAIELGKPPQGGVTHTVLYGIAVVVYRNTSETLLVHRVRILCPPLSYIPSPLLSLEVATPENESIN